MEQGRDPSKAGRSEAAQYLGFKRGRLYFHPYLLASERERGRGAGSNEQGGKVSVGQTLVHLAAAGESEHVRVSARCRGERV